MPLPTPRQHAPAEVRRAQILDAALGCLARGGYHATTMDDLARAAGLSKGSIYWHFEGKEDVFLAAFDHVGAKLIAQWDAAGEGGDRPALDVIEETSRQLLEFTSQRDSMLAFIEFLSHPSARERIAQIYRETRAHLAELLARGVERGEVRDLPVEAMAGALAAAGEGMLLLALVDATFDPGAHWEVLWKGLREGFEA
jgi:AcrR family transcriptional regulator